jgi:hypothetical protein
MKLYVGCLNVNLLLGVLSFVYFILTLSKLPCFTGCLGLVVGLIQIKIQSPSSNNFCLTLHPLPQCIGINLIVGLCVCIVFGSYSVPRDETVSNECYALSLFLFVTSLFWIAFLVYRLIVSPSSRRVVVPLHAPIVLQKFVARVVNHTEVMISIHEDTCATRVCYQYNCEFCSVARSDDCFKCRCCVCLESMHGLIVIPCGYCTQSVHVQCFCKYVETLQTLQCCMCRQP